MSFPTQCQNCFKAHDFTRECFGSCHTCHKDDMCENCCYTHECIEGKARCLQIITNPAWICNLAEELEKPHSESPRTEWGGTARCMTSDGRNVNMADELQRLGDDICKA